MIVWSTCCGWCHPCVMNHAIGRFSYNCHLMCSSIVNLQWYDLCVMYDPIHTDRTICDLIDHMTPHLVQIVSFMGCCCPRQIDPILLEEPYDSGIGIICITHRLYHSWHGGIDPIIIDRNASTTTCIDPIIHWTASLATTAWWSHHQCRSIHNDCNSGHWNHVLLLNACHRSMWHDLWHPDARIAHRHVLTPPCSRRYVDCALWQGAHHLCNMDRIIVPWCIDPVWPKRSWIHLFLWFTH